MRVQFIFYMTILKHISSIQCFLTANISATSTSRHPSGLENTAPPERRGEVYNLLDRCLLVGFSSGKCTGNMYIWKCQMCIETFNQVEKPERCFVYLCIIPGLRSCHCSGQKIFQFCQPPANHTIDPCTPPFLFLKNQLYSTAKPFRFLLFVLF